ncbi:MAG: ATP-dependent Clp protease ATP-binding subunit [Bryobacterales bacterium]|nr:ATP-dependent Clp protease ATP-binding subunit [Bryobacterales bacterium]
MRQFNESRPPRRPIPDTIEAALSDHIVGQSDAVEAIAPFVRLYQAGLAPDGRPVGVFLLLGPSGTGKTRTVEALAHVLHADDKKLVKIDCGEFQMEHEVAKLIGAPPGYLGHRETTPMLNQARLNQATSERCSLSLVLLDEIEKAAPSLQRLLLGVLDKATLRLGDNTTVGFERSLIFLTSNLGARDMLKLLKPSFGFGGVEPSEAIDTGRKLREIGMHAVRRHFSPEFVNRIDSIVAYQPLEASSLDQILDLQLAAVQRHICERLSARAFTLEVEQSARDFLIGEGVSPEYGARELKRTIHRRLLQPLATIVTAGRIQPYGTVRVLLPEGETELVFAYEPSRARTIRRVS